MEAGRTILDAGIFTQDVTLNGAIGAQRMANAMSGASNPILDLHELNLLKVGNFSLSVEGASRYLGVLSVGLTLIDMRAEGINWSNGTDLVFDIVAFVPVVGWAISGTYFLSNTIVKGVTNQSIGDYIGNMVNSAPPLDFDTGGGYEGTVP